MGEHRLCKPRVWGSIPQSSTIDTEAAAALVTARPATGGWVFVGGTAVSEPALRDRFLSALARWNDQLRELTASNIRWLVERANGKR